MEAGSRWVMVCLSFAVIDLAVDAGDAARKLEGKTDGTGRRQ